MGGGDSARKKLRFPPLSPPISGVQLPWSGAVILLAYALPGLVNRAGPALPWTLVRRRGTVKILLRNLADAWTGVFLLKGKSPRELFSHRDLSRRTSYPVRQVSALTEESVMGIIA